MEIQIRKTLICNGTLGKVVLNPIVSQFFRRFDFDRHSSVPHSSLRVFPSTVARVSLPRQSLSRGGTVRLLGRAAVMMKREERCQGADLQFAEDALAMVFYRVHADVEL